MVAFRQGRHRSNNTEACSHGTMQFQSFHLASPHIHRPGSNRSSRSTAALRSKRYRLGGQQSKACPEPGERVLGSMFTGLKADARSNGSTRSPRAESPVQPLAFDFAGLRLGARLNALRQIDRKAVN